MDYQHFKFQTNILCGGCVVYVKRILNISALAEKFSLNDNPAYQQYWPMPKIHWLSDEKPFHPKE